MGWMKWCRAGPMGQIRPTLSPPTPPSHTLDPAPMVLTLASLGLCSMQHPLWSRADIKCSGGTRLADMAVYYIEISPRLARVGTRSDIPGDPQSPPVHTGSSITLVTTLVTLRLCCTPAGAVSHMWLTCQTTS